MGSMLCSHKRNHILGNGAMKIDITRMAPTCGWATSFWLYSQQGRSYSSPWGSFAYTVENNKNDRTWALLV